MNSRVACTLLLTGIVLSGCSLIYDPSEHSTGSDRGSVDSPSAAERDGGPDASPAAPTDAGPSGPPRAMDGGSKPAPSALEAGVEGGTEAGTATGCTTDQDCSELATACSGAVCGADGICASEPLEDGTRCDDDNPCTDGDLCMAGACAPGPEVDCSALDDACRQGVCDTSTGRCAAASRPNGTECGGDECAPEPGTCQEGACSSSAVDCSQLDDQCGAGSCDPQSGTCAISVLEDQSCDDGDDCTYDDRCDAAGGCVGTAIACNDDQGPCGARRACDGSASCVVTYAGSSTSCTDGDPCTNGDVCDGAGACAGTVVPTCEGCSTNGDCEDGDQCTTNTCDGGRCVKTFHTNACTDGNACTYGDACDGAGRCVGTPIVCANDPATCGARRSCNGTASCGVSYPDAATTCTDGDPCTDGDACDGAGSCVGTAVTNCQGCTVGADCEDGNPCTTRTCQAGRCMTSFNTAVCNDQKACTHTDRCSGGVCAGTPITCNNDPSTCGVRRSCNGSSSCTMVYPDTSTVCSDGNLCTTADRCNGSGSCVGGAMPDCSSLNGPCRDGICDTGSGNCVPMNKTNGTTCDDFNACTGSDKCTDGLCAGVEDCGPGHCEFDACEIHVGLLWADSTTSGFEVADRLQSTGVFAEVVSYNVSSSTPSLAQLMAFDVVLVWSNLSFQNATTLGNVLADYYDAGGRVVVAMNAYYGPTSDLRGRFASSYMLFNTSTVASTNSASLGTVSEPASPLMAGVSSLSGSVALRIGGGTRGGSTVVARWNDSTPLVVRGTIGGRKRVDLNFYPPATSVGFTGNVNELLTNALTYE